MPDATLRRLVEGVETFHRGKHLSDDAWVRSQHFVRILFCFAYEVAVCDYLTSQAIFQVLSSSTQAPASSDC